MRRLNKLTRLYLLGNKITNIESGEFNGLNKLNWLFLTGDNLTELNLTNATFESLAPHRCGDLYGIPWCASGLWINSPMIMSLTLDGAALSLGSFDVIVGETTSITDVSLVGLTFSDENPTDLSNLLGIATLDNVTVDQALYELYASEFAAFAALDGNTVSVIPNLLPADFNNDGVVNAADYTVWRNRLGTIYTQEDYDVWKASYGATASTSSMDAAVPEPSIVWLVVVGILGLVVRRR